MRVICVLLLALGVPATGWCKGFFQLGYPSTPEGVEAEHIFVFRIDAVRSRDLSVAVEEELRGRLRQRTGTLSLHDEDSLWWTRYYPVPRMIVAGQRNLAICDGSSDDIAALLTLPHCRRTLLPGPDSDVDRYDPFVLEDVRLIVALEERGAPLEELLGIARSQSDRRGSRFAEFVGAAIATRPLGERRRPLELLLDLAASPASSDASRRAYLSVVAEQVSPPYRPHPDIELRLIRMLFHMWTSGETRFVHEGILIRLIGLEPEPDLPDSIKRQLHMDRRRPFYSVEEVFRGARRERAAVIAIVRAASEQHWRRPLLDWLTSGNRHALVEIGLLYDVGAPMWALPLLFVPALLLRRRYGRREPITGPGGASAAASPAEPSRSASRCARTPPRRRRRPRGSAG